MKRLLSIILALAMITALIPAVFATGETETDGVMVEYSFAGTYGDDPRTALNYSSTNGRLTYEGTDSVQTSFGYNGGLAYFDIRDGNYVAFKIRVPIAGEYGVQLDVRDGDRCNKLTVDMYILPGDTDDIKNTLTTETALIADICKTSGTYSYSTNKELDAGEYIIAFKRTGFVDGNTVTEHNFRPKLLTLTTGSGTGRALIYADMSISDEDAVLDAGNDETAEITLSNVYMSDGALATDEEKAAIEYVSTNETIATVSGTTITAKAVGTAAIQAKAGDYVLAEKEITVTNGKLSGVTVEYSFIGGAGKVPADLTYSFTKGRIAYDSVAGDSRTAVYCKYDDYTNFSIRPNSLVAFKIRVPASGTYNAALDLNEGVYSSKAATGCAIVSVHIFPASTSLSLDALNDDNKIMSEVGKSVGDGNVSAAGIKLDAGEYYLVFHRGTNTDADGNIIGYVPGTTSNDNMYSIWVNDFTLDGGNTETPLIWADIALGEDALEVGSTAAITLNNAYLSNGEAATDTTGITYKSTNEAVATVYGTTVTATGAGTAIIQAKNGDYVLGEATITVNTPEYTAAFTPSDTEPGITFDAIGVNALAYATDGSDIAPASLSAKDNENGTYTVSTDAEVDGYTFRYWAKGLSSKERKRIVSFEESFTYAPGNEQNYLIAVYTKEGTTPAKDEYYNANGQLIAAGEEPEKPYMAGYGQASDWKDRGNGIHEAVYGNPIEYDITIGNAEAVKYAWGEPVTCTAEIPSGKKFLGWKKTVNGADVGIVSTEESYVFYAWENCTVTPVYADNEPTFAGEMRRIILGTFELGGKNAYMAEFFNFEDAYERGIMVDGEAIAMTNKAATQFTIVDNEGKGNISGYAILADGTKCIYNYSTANTED